MGEWSRMAERRELVPLTPAQVRETTDRVRQSMAHTIEVMYDVVGREGMDVSARDEPEDPLPPLDDLDERLTCCGQTFERFSGEDPERAYWAHRKACHGWLGPTQERDGLHSDPQSVPLRALEG